MIGRLPSCLTLQNDFTEHQDFMHANELTSIRSRFPALSRIKNGHPVVFLDVPRGRKSLNRWWTECPNACYHHNANRSGRFDTSREIDQIMTETIKPWQIFWGLTNGNRLRSDRT